MRKIFLIIGVIFTVVSAIIFNFAISKNDIAISGFEGDVRKIDMKIDSSWKNSQFRWLSVQNIALTSQNNPDIINNNLIRNAFNVDHNIKSLEDLILKESVLQKELQNKIDEIFIARISVLEKIDHLVSKNDILKNIANLLNIIGLTLIVVSQYRTSLKNIIK
ncbi:MAG: hypothetical protein ACJA0S_000023 [Rickettsiales bacterium]|jgi:hypothetical protein